MQFPPLYKQQFNPFLQEYLDDIEVAFQKPIRSAIRYNPQKLSHHLQTQDPIPWCDNAYYLTQRPNFTLDPLFHAGTYYVQEASSMLLHVVIKFILNKYDRPIVVLDTCAAPGGKSTLINSLLKSEDILIVNEMHPLRNEALVHNIEKWGFANTIITKTSIQQLRQSGLKADIILIDAPCSGEGMFRKEDVAVKQWNPQLIQQCAFTQKQIIDDAIPMLNDGGFLVYSTCTFAKQEDEDQAQYIHQTHELLSLPIPFHTDWNIVEIFDQGIYNYHALPHLIEGEGLYLTVFQHRKNQISHHPNRKIHFKLKSVPYLLGDHDWFIFEKQEKVFALIPTIAQYLDMHSSLQKHIISAGIHIENTNPKSNIPSSMLALSTQLDKNQDSFELNDQTAIDFLKCSSYFHPSNTYSNTWIQAQYKHFTLGWLKFVDARLKNYYPIKRRIIKG